MKAITVEPLKANSAQLEQIDEPNIHDGSVLVESIAVGVCGTDAGIVDGRFGWPAPGKSRLVLGHESLGRVLDPGPSGSFRAGDLVVGIVRHPDPVPCSSCAAGESDMCRNGRYTERGIKQIDGFMSERWRVHPEFAIPVDRSLGLFGVLLEPASVVVKAWQHIDAIGRRASWRPQTVLVTGAGPVGLLAALIARQQGLDVHVLDRVTTGAKPALVTALGATYHTGSVRNLGFEPDVVVECTGASRVIADVVHAAAAGGIVCLIGADHGDSESSIPASEFAAAMVLKNTVVFGSVNANRRHWNEAASYLARADRAWLSGLISRREQPENFARALNREPDDIKVVIQFADI
jgi:threonine dehydrogenase-like Zn-dependent dehydrogenase